MLPETAVPVCVLFYQPHIHPTFLVKVLCFSFRGYHVTLSLCPHDLRGTDSSLTLWMSMWLRNDLDNYKKFKLSSGSQYGIILLPMGRTFGKALRHFWSSRLGRSVGEYSCILWHQGMLLNALLCTGKPPQWNFLVLRVNRAGVDSPDRKIIGRHWKVLSRGVMRCELMFLKL